MKKGSFISFLAGSVALISSLLSAQINDQSTKFENNRKISRGQGVTVLKSREINFTKKDFSLNLAKNKKTKRIYVKLNQPATMALLKKLQKDGMSLGEYLANDTYIVEVNDNKLNKLKTSFSVYGFSEIDYSDKLSEQLYKEEFNSNAKDGTYVNVIVSFYEDVSYNNAVSWVQSVGGIVKSKKFSRTHKLDISIHKMNIEAIAGLDIVKYVDEVEPPIETHNIHAGYLSQVFWGDDTGLFDTGYSLTGLGVNVAVKDGGAIYSHSDFGNRLTIIDNDSVSSHATHVAGTIGGELDIQNNVGGMAEGINLYSYSYNVDGSSGTTETDRIIDFISALAYSAPIVNNSWGATIGWTDAGTWSGTSNDYFGLYNSYAEDMDDFVYDYFDNDALLLKSAGNDRNDYQLGNPSNHDGTYNDNDGNYYDLIGTRGCSKNVITVGSVGTSESDCESSDFSSWGPTNDGRVKPDVVADGYYLRSTWDNDGYYSIPGTSMSCPVVTGICALIHQAYNDVYGEYPTADIVKALLCNFAEDLGKKGPDFAYGFGLIKAKRCIDTIENEGHIVTGIISEAGDYMEYQFIVGENETDNETVTLVWIDPAANPAATNSIVNDLDITVNGASTGYMPFFLKDYDDAPLLDVPEPTVDPTQDARIGYNRYDTVEQILMEPDNTGVIPAGTYTLRVAGFKVPILNQAFAVASSLQFNRFHFNNIKIKDRDGFWVPNTHGVFINDPELLLTFSDIDINTGFNPANMSIQYKYSSDGGQTWTENWQNVTGLYEDIDCTQSCSNPYQGIAYAKVPSVDFTGTVSGDNRIKFKLAYDTYTEYSREFIVFNYNVYFVSTTGSNSDTGSQENPWQTISHAISNVQGTTEVPAIIKIQKGTYNENIVLGNHVRLYGGYDTSWVSRELTNETNMTIIQGDGTTHVVAASNGNADNVILDGFVIKGGNAQEGGGVYLNQTSPTIRNCIIKNNTVENDDDDPKGAGIYAYVSYAKIENCIIELNTADATQGGYYSEGGGIYLKASYVEIKNCEIRNNTAQVTAPSSPGQSYGGGIYALGDNSKIINSVINSNTATSSAGSFGGGVFIYAFQDPVTFDIFWPTTNILGCRIYSNSGQGGIYSSYAPDAIITNCTIYGNGVIGIQLSSYCSYITNTIIWNNTYDLYGTLSSDKITYCCIQDGNFDGINGNINDNPQFVSANTNDFRIKNISPCIDAGNDGAPSLSLLERDFQNQERIFEFDNSGTESVDIGADEYVFGFSSPNGLVMDNDGVTLTWESLAGKVYFVEYTEDDLGDSPTWTQVQADNEGVVGLNQTTSWTDDGSEISPDYDDQSVTKRFYRIFFEN